jgi:transcriptional regulator with XRE-family HTH domain
MAKSIHSEQHACLRQLLKAAREKAGLTQDQLTERLGAYKTFVSKYESGDRRLDVIEFLAVTSAIGVDPIVILRDLNDTSR